MYKGLSEVTGVQLTGPVVMGGEGAPGGGHGQSRPWETEVESASQDQMSELQEARMARLQGRGPASALASTPGGPPVEEHMMAGEEDGLRGPQRGTQLQSCRLWRPQRSIWVLRLEQCTTLRTLQERGGSLRGLSAQAGSVLTWSRIFVSMHRALVAGGRAWRTCSQVTASRKVCKSTL